MAVKGTAEVTLNDLTDAYNVILTSYEHTFDGTATAAVAGTFTLQAIATCGGSVVDCSIDNDDITGAPAGVTTSVSKGTGALSPTVTVTVSAAFKTSGTLTIPVTVQDGPNTLTYELKFSVGVRLAAVTISKTEYQAGTSATTAPTGTWSTSPVAVAEGGYLWTRLTFTDGSTSYSVARQGVSGSAGTSVTVKSTAYAYQLSSSGTTPPTGTWSTSPVAPTTTQYAWTRTTTTFSDGSTAVTYTVGGKVGTNGTSSYTHIRYSTASNGNPMVSTPTDATLYIGVYTGTSSTAPTSYSSYTWSRYTGKDGDNPYTLSITTNNGDTFRNHSGTTTLTAHVYQAGAELTSVPSGLAVKWYKDGTYLTGKDGLTLTVSASDVSTKAVYRAVLEG